MVIKYYTDDDQRAIVQVDHEKSLQEFGPGHLTITLEEDDFTPQWILGFAKMILENFYIMRKSHEANSPHLEACEQFRPMKSEIYGFTARCAFCSMLELQHRGPTQEMPLEQGFPPLPLS